MLKYVWRRPVDFWDWLDIAMVAIVLLVPLGFWHDFLEQPYLWLVPLSLIALLALSYGLLRYDAINASTAMEAHPDAVEGRLRMLSDHLDHMREGLAQIQALVPELEAVLGVKREAIKNLQKETESLDRLAALQRIDTAPIQELITQTVRVGQRLTTRSSRRRDFAFLVTGLLLSLPLGLLVNFSYDEWVK